GYKDHVTNGKVDASFTVAERGTMLISGRWECWIISEEFNWTCACLDIMYDGPDGPRPSSEGCSLTKQSLGSKSVQCEVRPVLVIPTKKNEAGLVKLVYGWAQTQFCLFPS